jgi:hypothetical protein
MFAEATTGSGSPIAHRTFTGSALRCNSFLSTNSSYLNGIASCPSNENASHPTNPQNDIGRVQLNTNVQTTIKVLLNRLALLSYLLSSGLRLPQCLLLSLLQS